MRSLHRLTGQIVLAIFLVAAGLTALPAAPADAAPPAQYPGYPWGGGGIWPGGLHRAPAASAGCAALRAP